MCWHPKRPSSWILRSESPEALNTLVQQVDGVICCANKEGVKIEFEVIGQRPAGEIVPTIR